MWQRYLAPFWLVTAACSGGSHAKPPSDVADANGPPGDAARRIGAGSAEAGAGEPDGSDGGAVSEGGGPSFQLPPLNAPFDYQLGGDYAPPAGVQIVSRDRNGSPAPGLYNICYVNGFQTQPDERDFWLEQHSDLVLRDSSGAPVIDPDWPDELLLDVSTPAKREALIAIEKIWLAGCSQNGFDAVEIDNLDTYSRSGGRITRNDAVAMIRLLADVAHAHGLAIAQKNASEIAGRKTEMGTDFVVAEECNTYDECGTYTDVYGNHVLIIEYTRKAFDKGCRDYPDLSIVLRDRDVLPEGSSGYVFDAC
jgi:hypothetical protein